MNPRPARVIRLLVTQLACVAGAALLLLGLGNRLALAQPPAAAPRAPAGAQSPIKPVSISIDVANATSLAAFEFDLDYDPQLVDVIGAVLNGAFGSMAANCNASVTRCAFDLGPLVQGGRAAYGAASYGAGAQPSGNLQMVRIWLQPKARAGTSPLNLSGIILADQQSNPQAASGINASITFSAPQQAFLPFVGRNASSSFGSEQMTPARAATGPLARVPQTPSTPSDLGCAVGDANCDGLYNVLDFQALGAAIVVTNPPSVTVRALDVDGDGVIARPDAVVLAPAWRTLAKQLAGGPPRLGYAVNPAGEVFLRWILPTSPYSYPIEIIRQPAPAGAPPSVITGAGVLTTLSPITDNATALPLLGANWQIIRVSVSSTTDISGYVHPLTLTSVAAMHAALQNGGNPFALNALINESPGVARVMGKGTLDRDFTATGVYSYWVRSNGRIVGPLFVTTTQPTTHSAPALAVYSGTGSISTTLNSLGLPVPVNASC